MRFCKSVKYPVYRPSAEHTFAELDFDSHAGALLLETVGRFVDRSHALSSMHANTCPDVLLHNPRMTYLMLHRVCAHNSVYKKIVPHMRISERHFELPSIEECRANFREFLCRRNFPVSMCP